MNLTGPLPFDGPLGSMKWASPPMRLLGSQAASATHEPSP